MSDNYELAISQARGDYVLVVGDDDGLMPYALRELNGLIERYDRPGAVHWLRGLYTWPTIKNRDDANILLFSTDWDHRLVDGREMLRRAAKYEFGADMLPMINTAAIRHDLIERHREIAGRVFVSMHSDIYTGYAFSYLAGQYVSVNAPMSVAGLSSHSIGVSVLFRDTEESTNDLKEDFYSQSRAAGLEHHPTVPKLDLMPVHCDDAFQHAKQNLFLSDSSLALDRKKMVDRYLASIPDESPGARSRIRALIRDCLKDDASLLQWFDVEAPEYPPCRPPRLKPPRFGFETGSAIIDASRFGIKNIFEAVNFAADLLAFRSAPIPFERPSWKGTIDWHRSDAVAKERETVAKQPLLQKTVSMKKRALEWASRRLRRLLG